MKKNLISGYYFITDASLSLNGDLSDVRNAQEAGVNIIQYRAKCLDTQNMFAQALKLRTICKRSKLIINDRLDIALAVDADGVHLGQDDLPVIVARKILGRKKIIGISTHSYQQIMDALTLPVDYIAIGPIFATQTKKNAAYPVGVELIKGVRLKVKKPIVAIGGINLDNAPSVISAGADSVCAISSVVTCNDVIKQIKKFQNLF